MKCNIQIKIVSFEGDEDPYEMGFNEVHNLDDILPAIKRSIKRKYIF